MGRKEILLGTNQPPLPLSSSQRESSQRDGGSVTREGEGEIKGKRRKGRERQEGRAGRKYLHMLHVAAEAAEAAVAAAGA